MLTPKDKKVMTSLFSMEERTLYKFMYIMLQKHYKEEDIELHSDYIIAQGTLPIGLLAHMDTVFAKKPTSKNIYYDSEKGVMWCPEGLGADDRAGVFLIIKLLNSFSQKPTVILTLGEEKGGLGASAVIGQHPENEYGLKFLIELDRQGKDDSVYYDCGNEEFEKYINRFGFTTDWGTFTDISVIAPAWDIAAVNLSVGYFHEHTKTEILVIPYLFATLEKVKKICKNFNDIKDKEFKHCTKKWYEDYYTAIYGGSYDIICRSCKKQMPSDLSIPFKTRDGAYAFICPDCFETEYVKFNWCGYCGEAFEPPEADKDAVFCKHCKSKIIE